LGQRFPVKLGPYEVLTLRVALRAGLWQATICDMIERAE
jgi:hypothetical protein